jgi:DNA-binding transcriptional regulator YhcF (GntR family)
MSRKSNDWAWNQALKPTLKLTLLSLADRTNETHECFPSYSRLVKDTNLNIKTIQKNIKILLDMGIIKDTGKRKGSTQQVKVLKFTFINAEMVKQPKNGCLSNTPKNGYVSEGKPPKSGRLNTPKNGCLKATLNRATEPPSLFNHPINHTVIETGSNLATVKTKSEPKSKATWLAYANAYKNRYGHEPIRSAKVNKQLCLLVDEVGQDAPMIAEYYLYLNDNWYQKKGHDVSTLLQNAQAIRTQWLNQSNKTSIDHRTNERRSSTLDAANRVKAQIARGEF